MRRWRGSLLLPGAAVVAVLAVPLASRQGAAAVQADRAVPFSVGETLTYDVAWSDYLVAGTAVMSVKERQPATGGFNYDLVADGRTTGLVDRLYRVYYKNESLLSTKTLQPSMTTLFSDERGHTTLRTTRFVGPTTIEIEPSTGAPKQRHTVPKLALDPLSALYVIRASPPKLGQTVTMTVVDDSDVYTVRWQFASREPVTTPLGTRPAWRLIPTVTDASGKLASAYHVTVWLSDDARRLPLKIEAGLPVGRFTLALTRITP